MAAFRNQNWDDRFKSMGDQAEAEFEARHTRWARFGWNRPDISMGRIPPKINYAPDYALDYGSGVALVEVQGCGQDQWFKFKDDKVLALKQWKTFSEMDVYLWLWDAHNGRAFWISVDGLWKRILSPRLYGGKSGTFPEGKSFVKFQAETFDLEQERGT